VEWWDSVGQREGTDRSKNGRVLATVLAKRGEEEYTLLKPPTELVRSWGPLANRGANILKNKEREGGKEKWKAKGRFQS